MPVHGPWSIDVRGDEFADIRFDGVLLLRAVRPVVRDRDWNTVPVAVLGRATRAGGSSLVIRLRFAADDIDYEARLAVQLSDHELAVRFDGQALVDFERNRIGLVVLHPAADAGRAVRVEHTDGRITAGSWPTDISPHQPFRDVAGFAWDKDGVSALLMMAGDVFETEDQRNWTDASFKTYSTPLDRPFPVPVPAGSRCRQSVRLTAAGRAAGGRRTAEPGDTVMVGATVTGTLPPISVAACLYPPPARPAGIPPVFETVLVELRGDEERWPEQLRSATAQAAASATGLDVRILTADPDAVERGVARLAGHPVVRLGVFDQRNHISTAPLWTALRDAAHRRGITAALLGGTSAHFTELNRQIAQVPAEVGTLSFSITPQMHASEIPHLLDSLAMQRVVAGNARRLAGDRPVLVGPITLARRFNAVATSAAADPAVDAVRAIDPRQPSPFAGAWTLGSIAALTAAGVSGLCYYETSGPRGIVGPDGTLTPAGRVLSALAGRRGCPVLHVEAPAEVAAVAVATGSGAIELHIANLTETPRTITVRGPDGRSDTMALEGWAVTSTEHRSVEPGAAR